MGYQKPGEDHPWRRYKNKTNGNKEEKKYKPVKILITEIAESWDQIEIYTTQRGREDRFTLSSLPQSKQASWVVGMLKKYYSSL